MQQLASQQFPLQPIGNTPGAGPICMGQLGPGPCDAIRNYLMQHQPGAPPLQNFDATRPQLINANGADNLHPMCNGPVGPVPCNLVGQMSLDRFGGQISSPATFGVAPGGNPQQTAIDCAGRVGLDVAKFAGCAGQQIILPEDQQKMLDCAVSGRDTSSFANCAVLQFGMSLSDNQRVLAQCALKTGGDRSAFISCAGGILADRNLNADEQAILNCASNAGGDAGGWRRAQRPTSPTSCPGIKKRWRGARFLPRAIGMALRPVQAELF